MPALSLKAMLSFKIFRIRASLVAFNCKTPILPQPQREFFKSINDIMDF